jgi:holo-[acyl-carrier protein] synthase
MIIGIDILEIAFIEKMMDKYNSIFLDRYFSKYEIEEYRYSMSFQYLAGRFAAKEAIYKATNFDFIATEISILKDVFGQPQIYLGNSKRIVKNIISISHTSTLAIAFVHIKFWDIWRFKTYVRQ